MKSAVTVDIASLADEQAALRRVATLVAAATDPLTVFDVVTREASQLLNLPVPQPHAIRARWNGDYSSRRGVGLTVSRRCQHRARWPKCDRHSLETGQQARFARLVRRTAWRSSGQAASGGCESRIWRPDCRRREGLGRDGSGADHGNVPDDAEKRLANFTDLIAIAISNAQARDDLSRLAAEQASLRRVATLVASGSAGEDLFSGVAAEVQKLFDVPDVALVRSREQREDPQLSARPAKPVRLARQPMAARRAKRLRRGVGHRTLRPHGRVPRRYRRGGRDRPGSRVSVGRRGADSR